MKKEEKKGRKHETNKNQMGSKRAEKSGEDKVRQIKTGGEAKKKKKNETKNEKDKEVKGKKQKDERKRKTEEKGDKSKKRSRSW